MKQILETAGNETFEPGKTNELYHKSDTDIITITNGAAWSIEFQTNGGYFDTRKKSLETRSEAECF